MRSKRECVDVTDLQIVTDITGSKAINNQILTFNLITS